MNIWDNGSQSLLLGPWRTRCKLALPDDVVRAGLTSRPSILMAMFLQVKNTREKFRYVGIGALIILSFMSAVVVVTAILSVVLRID